MIEYRKIAPGDNATLAGIIRAVMMEYDVDHSKTILGDPVHKSMYEAFLHPQSVYFIAEENGKMLGGSGIHPLPGASEEICELQRMFLLPEARGRGIGKTLMEKCIQAARGFGFRKIYLETLYEMKEAARLYDGFGFVTLAGRLGVTGHDACNKCMMLELK